MAPNRPRFASPPGAEDLLLDHNERTRAPSARVTRALERYVLGAQLNVYPDHEELPGKLAAYARVSADRIMITNGASHAIDVVFRTFMDIGDTVVIPSPSFVMLYRYAQLVGAEIVRPSFGREDGSFPLGAVLAALDERVRVVVICNPNNPTGTSVALEDIARVARAAPDAVVLVDEAYFELSGITAVPLMGEHPNIVVVRTFSKAFGLAALRIGYLVADPRRIAAMERACCPYDVNMAARIAAAAAVEDTEDLASYVEEVMGRAKPIVETFLVERGIAFYPSAANFLLIKPAHPEALAEKLREKGIVVRALNSPGFEGTIRVTIGTVEQMRRLVDGLAQAGVAAFEPSADARRSAPQ